MECLLFVQMERRTCGAGVEKGRMVYSKEKYYRLSQYRDNKRQ